MTPERSTMGPASQRDGQGSKDVDATAAARRRALGAAPREADLTTARAAAACSTILNSPLLTQVCARTRALGAVEALARAAAARVAYPHDDGTRCPETWRGRALMSGLDAGGRVV